jgi:hypothetical protein
LRGEAGFVLLVADLATAFLGVTIFAGALFGAASLVTTFAADVFAGTVFFFVASGFFAVLFFRAAVICAFNSALSSATLIVVAYLRSRSRP